MQQHIVERTVNYTFSTENNQQVTISKITLIGDTFEDGYTSAQARFTHNPLEDILYYESNLRTHLQAAFNSAFETSLCAQVECSEQGMQCTETVHCDVHLSDEDFHYLCSLEDVQVVNW